MTVSAAEAPQAISENERNIRELGLESGRRYGRWITNPVKACWCYVGFVLRFVAVLRVEVESSCGSIEVARVLLPPCRHLD
jgi:hypothetical protein